MSSRSRTWKIFGLMTSTCILLCNCVQQYVSPHKSPATGYLVVDGYILGNGATQYSLSRTIPLPGDSAIPVVTGATMEVEGNDQSIYPLTEQGNGVYSVDTLPLSTAVQYRLRITCPNGETYLSDYVRYKPTPPIDSVTWFQNSDGVNIFLTAHDPGNSTRYYQWNYLQTYEYNSAEESYYYYDPASDSIIARSPSQQIYTCWRNIPQNTIAVGTSSQLAQDVIYKHPLLTLAPPSPLLAIEYSINVSQYSLTDSGYAFLSLMQQNTEALGSIFDAQPTQITGNIHSLSNPAEPVIGFVSAGTVQQMRIFIRRSQVLDWVWDFVCPTADSLIPNDPGMFPAYFAGMQYTNPSPSGVLEGWFINQAGCVDCRAQGGTTTKPSYWPN